jgi:hypothetical protein
MAMDVNEKAAFLEALENLGAMAIVLGATLAIVKQEIPDFKMRAIGTLTNATTHSSAALGTKLNARKIVAKASRFFAGL